MPRQLTMDRRAAIGVLGGASLAPVALAGRTEPVRAAAPALGAARPAYYRFKLGQFEVTTLLDGAVQVDGPHPIFGQDQTPEAVQKLAEANFLPPTRMEIGLPRWS